MTFAGGSGGWCGCNCNCCPPATFSSMAVGFCVGTPSNNWQGPAPDTGCATAALLKRLPTVPMMPAFGLEPIGSEDGTFVFALSAGGCIPGETVVVTIVTTGLGFRTTGGTGIAQVGDGTVTATISPGFKAGCGTLTGLINGVAAYPGLDGDTIVVSIDIGDTSLGCTATLSTVSPASLMAMTLAQILHRKRQIRRANIATKQRALKAKRNVTFPRSKPTSEPQP